VIIDKAYEALRNHMVFVEYQTLQLPILIPNEEQVDRKAKPFGRVIALVSAHDGHGSVKNAYITRMAMRHRNEYSTYHGYILSPCKPNQAQRRRHPC